MLLLVIISGGKQHYAARQQHVKAGRAVGPGLTEVCVIIRTDDTVIDDVCSLVSVTDVIPCYTIRCLQQQLSAFV